MSMRIRWRNFELPSQVSLDPATASPSFGRFLVEPFERGFGTTIGNGLRRVLLSSIEGAAVYAVRIEGVVHEFSTIPGVLEDVTIIILNIKKLRVKMHTDAPVTMRIDVQRGGVVTAADIQADHNVEVVNPDLHICTLTENVRFYCEIMARRGRGYVTAEENATEDMEVGTIPVDSIFSPVFRVKYAIENTRVGKFTNYDRLVLEIWTDGTVTPEMALVEAAKIYRKHLNPFVLYQGGADDSPVAEDPSTSNYSQRNREMSVMSEMLARPIAELELSVRARNCLDGANIQTLRDLVSLSENEVMNLKNLGKTSLTEIKTKLSEQGLSLGMKL